MITASHNPSKDNGYKVYGPDGCQITTDMAAGIYEKIKAVDFFDGIWDSKTFIYNVIVYSYFTGYGSI